MAVKFEKLEENKVKLTVTVDAEEFNNALDVAFKKVNKDVAVPGFRKGHLPRAMFEKRFGVEALYEEAVNYIVPKFYPDAVKETGIDPVAQPDVDFDYENMGKDKPFTFYATVVVKPEVKLGQYKGLEVVPLSKEVADEDVQNEINRLLNQHAELVVKETEAVNGDTVVIDYEGSVNDVPFEGGKASNYSLTLGSNSFIPGFEEQLVGIKANESKTINVKFPDEYHAEDLKGKDAKFAVTCHEVKGRVLPELNDDFVKELNRENVSSVDELKTSIKEQLTVQKESAAKNHLIDTIVEAASSNAQINIPQEMIDNEADRMFHDSEHRLEHQGINMNLYLQYTGMTREGLLEQLKTQAAKRIRYNLTLEQIAKEENIQVTQDDLDKEFENIAKEYNVTADEVKKSFTDTQAIEENIKLHKALDLIVENSVKL